MIRPEGLTPFQLVELRQMCKPFPTRNQVSIPVYEPSSLAIKRPELKLNIAK